MNPSETELGSTSAQNDPEEGVVLDPIYIRTSYGENYELNWPIWHRLPHRERKEIANQHGFKSIGEFEESVILTQTLRQVDENDDHLYGDGVTARNTTAIHDLEKRTTESLYISSQRSQESKGKDDDSIISSMEEEEILGLSSTSYHPNQQLSDTNEDHHGDISEGGFIMTLPDELIIHHIMIFLSTEYYALCSLVSPHWKKFTRSELAYKEVCKRCYLNQSKRKTLHVSRFGGSYRTMLEKRWRVKVGCGLYVLKCTKIKQIQRDMWTEIPVGAVLESTYYRYLYFYEDGRVLYSLTSKAPHEMVPIFKKIYFTGDAGHSGIFGSYEIQKDNVVVNVKHPWHHVRFHLKVLDQGAFGPGLFWELKLERHLSSAKNDFDEYWSRDLVEYNVPVEHFRFIRNWQL
jgi:F-box protein 9